MIKFDKSANIPSILLKPNVATRLEQHADEIENGISPSIRDTIYKHKTVRDKVYSDQTNRCCYCEKQIERSNNDVEHYRPKKSVRHDNEHNGYWWLAYTWANLLFSCANCNRSGKNDLFPLSPDSQRAYTPTSNLDNESPEIFNPSTEEIERHFDYKVETTIVDGRDGSKFDKYWVDIVPSENGNQRRAQITIDAMKLNREDLRELRGGMFASLKMLTFNDDFIRKYIQEDQNGRDEIVSKIKILLVDGPHPFAGITLNFIRALENEAA